MAGSGKCAAWFASALVSVALFATGDRTSLQDMVSAAVAK